MSSTFIKGVAGVSAVGGLSTGGFFAYKSFQPKNVREVLVKEGLTLADVRSVGSWKVIAMSNKDNDGFFAFLGVEKSSDRKILGSALRENCGKVLDTSIKDENYSDLLSKAKLWCLQPTPKNLEEQLLMDDLETDLSENDFKNVHKIFFQDGSFKADIERTKGDKSTDWEKAKNWCLEEFKKPANSPRVIAKDRCTTPPKNLGEVLQSSGLSLISSVSGWKDKYSSIKNPDDGLKSDISSSGSLDTDDAGGTALSAWCNTETSKDIHSLAGNYNDHLNKVKKRCV